jgi:hypothetical protein
VRGLREIVADPTYGGVQPRRAMSLQSYLHIMQKPLFPLLLLFCSLPAFGQIHTFAVAPDATMLRPAAQILIAGSGSVQGANGTFFHSDIVVLNYRTVSQRVAFTWLPNGQTAGAPMFLTINASSGIISEDFVGTILGQSGLGALLITGVDSTGALDPSAQLYATERVWTPQPGSGGTVSQSFPPIATSDINLTRATILGQRLDARYRTNVGIVNLDTVARTFDVVQTTDDPTAPQNTSTVTVQPMSMVQIPLPNLTSSALQIAVQPEVAINPALWMAYGSSVDNSTGDSWSSLGFQAR